jgi:hypothetical protein
MVIATVVGHVVLEERRRRLAPTRNLQAG